MLNGYKVVFVPFSDGKPSGMPQDVVTGFLERRQSGARTPRGPRDRQVGGATVADDVGNTVWRVTSGNQQVTQSR